MRQAEVVGIGDVAGDAVAAVVERIEDMHDGIAERAFGSVGPGAAGVRVVHDAIAHGVYAGVRSLCRAAVRGGARAVAARQALAGRDTGSLEDRPAGRIALGALNGAFGDALAGRGSELALPMTARAGGRDIEIDRGALRAAFPNATAKLAIFAHGLCETDDAWGIRATRCAPYGARLRADLGYTPVYLRYNSGRHISDNGRELSRLLEDLVREWPVAVAEIALIGHSMGGLVARSACHYGAGEGVGWVSLVRHVFMLGTPHAGAPLEQAAHAASAALALLPETRTLARALNSRSVGIKDLRYGYLVEEDWFGHDADAYMRRAASEIPFLDGANHYFVAATISRAEGSLAARIVGDLLVLRASAWGDGGKGEQFRFDVDNYRHFGGATHFDLLNHPDVYEQLRAWLGGSRAVAALPAA
jgi:hypothetical protein